MVQFFRELVTILDRQARAQLLVTMLAMSVLSVVEGGSMLLVLPMLQLVFSGGRSTSTATRILSAMLGHTTGQRLEILAAVLVLSLFFVKDVFAVLLNRRNIRFSSAEGVKVGDRVFRGFLRAPYRFHLDRNSAELQRTVNQSMQQIFGSSLVWAYGAVGDVLSVILIGAALAVINWVLAAVIAVYFLVVILLYQRRVSAKMDSSSKALYGMQATSFRLVAQALAVVKELKILHREQDMADEVHSLWKSVLPHSRATTLAVVQPRYYLEMALLGATGVIGVVAAFTTSAANAPALAGLFLVGGFRLLSPMNKVSTGVIQARLALPAIRQVRDDLRAVGLAPDGGAPDGSADQARAASGQAGHDDGREVVLDRWDVDVRDLHFGYSEQAPVLRGVSMHIPDGAAAAIVGGSGAGKTTLVDILLGLLEPQSGQVLVGGVPLGDALHSWQRRIGYVPQAIALIDDTVLANVALGVPPGDVDRDRVREALEAAEVASFVETLPEGVDTRIGEAGIRLSGGQRQRLGIARALYHRPRVLFLDEATSALDNETEALIGASLRHLRGSLTMITIAHRLSTIRDSDVIFYLEQGRLVASGRFDQLAATVPGFGRMVDLARLPGGGNSSDGVADGIATGGIDGTRAGEVLPELQTD